MVNQCRGCKRELARDQKTCYQCGSSQNYFRYHLKTVFFILTLSVIFSAISYWYVDKTVKAIELEKAQISDSKNEVANLQLNQVETELAQAKNLALEHEAKLIKAVEETNQLKLQLKKIKQELVDAENKTIETEKKAGWLLKLNRQLKEEVSTLTAKLPADEQVLLKNEEPQLEPATP